MLLRFAHWLDTHAWSTAIHESLYGYPLIESTHVWALAFFVGFAILLDLRLLGWTFRNVPVSDLAKRLLPWTIGSFVIMIATGLLLFYAIPVRTYHSVWFRAKVILLILAGINVFVFHRGIWLKVADWDLARKPPGKARFAGAASLVLWSFIIIFGRMIAYNWFDCDRQPQTSFINWAADCQPEHFEKGPLSVVDAPTYVDPPSYPDSPQVVNPPSYPDSPQADYLEGEEAPGDAEPAGDDTEDTTNSENAEEGGDS